MTASFRGIGKCHAFDGALTIGHIQPWSLPLVSLINHEAQGLSIPVVGLTPPTILPISSGEVSPNSLHKTGPDGVLRVSRFCASNPESKSGYLLQYSLQLIFLSWSVSICIIEHNCTL